jgi:hypothetical protein
VGTASSMSNSEEETSQDRGDVDDEQLPEDLKPSEDNPLAGGLDEGESVDDLLEGGKKAEQMEEEEAEEDDEEEGDASDT